MANDPQSVPMPLTKGNQTASKMKLWVMRCPRRGELLVVRAATAHDAIEHLIGTDQGEEERKALHHLYLDTLQQLDADGSTDVVFRWPL